ncbi:MAG: S24 family peptidase [Thermodesulfobacteriota bacterium]
MCDLIVNSNVVGELASEVLGRGGDFCLGVHGRSMLPFVRHGARLTVKGVAPEALRVGDIVLYRSEGRLLAHRIVNVENSGTQERVYARGDAFYGRPDAVLPGQILGLVVRVTHGSRTMDLRSTLWRILGRAWIAATPVSQACLGVALKARNRLRRLSRRLSGQTSGATHREPDS